MVSHDGYLQLMDMAFAVKCEGANPRDYCGAAHYLSPEQVSGQGHDKAVDYWALGIVMHEMLLDKNPWLTGDDVKDSELGIYGRISAHKQGEIQHANLADKAETFLNLLLEPNPEQRLGVRGVGPEEVRAAGWMSGMDWVGLSNRSLQAPHAAAIAKIQPPPASLTDKYDGDSAWCDSWTM